MSSIENKLKLIKDACEDKKAEDIEIIDVSSKTPMADYFVIASGNSSNQTMAIADGIEDKLEEYIESNFKKEGYNSGRWILMDLGDVIVHIFHKEEREFYDLERLWSLEERIDNN